MTKTIAQRCDFSCGPYKGYCGRAEYDSEHALFHGEVLGTRDVITFQAADFNDLTSAFQKSVDDYVAFCKASGDDPEKPFSGKFVARLHPSLHRQLASMAEASGKSLNQFVCDCLEAFTQAGGATASSPRSALKRKPVRARKQRERASRL